MFFVVSVMTNVVVLCLLPASSVLCFDEHCLLSTLVFRTVIFGGYDGNLQHLARATKSMGFCRFD